LTKKKGFQYMSGLTDKLVKDNIDNSEHKSDNTDKDYGSVLSETSVNRTLRSPSQPNDMHITISSAYSNRSNKISTDSSVIRPPCKTFCLQVWTGIFVISFVVSYFMDAIWSDMFNYVADIIAILAQMLIIVLCKIFIDEVYRDKIPLGYFTKKLKNAAQVKHNLTENQCSITRTDGDKSFLHVCWIIFSNISINLHTFSAGMCCAYYLSLSAFMVPAIMNSKTEDKTEYIIVMIRYLVNSISIPIPAILLQLFYKFANYDHENANEHISNLTKKVAHKFGILSEDIFQVLLFAQYTFILARVVSIYALDKDDYVTMMNCMYGCQDNSEGCKSTPAYIINEIILRPFVGMTLINTLSILLSRACDSKLNTHNKAKHNHSAVNLSNLFSKVNFLIFPVIIVLFILDAQYANPNGDHKWSGEWVFNGVSIILNSIGILIAIYLWFITHTVAKTNEWMLNKHRYLVPTSKSLVVQLALLLVLSMCVLVFIVYYDVGKNKDNIFTRHIRNMVIFAALLVQSLGLFHAHKISKWHEHFAKNISSSVTNNNHNSLIDPTNPSLLYRARNILIILCALNLYNFLYQFVFVATEFRDALISPSTDEASSTDETPYDDINLVAYGLSFAIPNWIFLSIALCLDFIEKYDKYEMARKNKYFPTKKLIQPNNGNINDLKKKRKKKRRKKSRQRKITKSITPSVSEMIFRNTMSAVDDVDAKQAIL